MTADKQPKGQTAVTLSRLGGLRNQEDRLGDRQPGARGTGVLALTITRP